MSHWHWVLEDCKLTSSEKLVALAIISHQYKGRSVNPSQARLAMLTGLGERTVRLCISRMEKKGYCIIVTKGVWHHTNRYRIRQENGLLFSTRCKFPTVLDQTRPATIAAQTTSDRQPLPPEVRNFTVTSKDKTRAQNPRTKPAISEQEQRRRIEARDHRLLKEEEIRRELGVGSGPEIPARIQGAA